jgi:hypothetical protein
MSGYEDWLRSGKVGIWLAQSSSSKGVCMMRALRALNEGGESEKFFKGKAVKRGLLFESVTVGARDLRCKLQEGPENGVEGSLGFSFFAC